MQKNSESFSIEDAKKLASSATAQQLLTMLQQKDAQAFSQAAQQAQKGNYAAASQSLNQILSDPDVQKLLKQLGR